eukprot:COSAG02_NODE_61940_length_267_cov_0.619048_1_plen_52_part_01
MNSKMQWLTQLDTDSVIEMIPVQACLGMNTVYSGRMPVCPRSGGARPSVLLH